MLSQRITKIGFVLLALFALLSQGASAATISKARLERKTDTNILVLDANTSFQYKVVTNLEGRDFTIVLSNSRSQFDFNRLKLENSYISRVVAKRNAGNGNLSIRIFTNRPVNLAANVLLMPKGQGERLLLRLKTKLNKKANVQEVGVFALELEKRETVYKGSLLTSNLVQKYHIYSLPLKASGAGRFSLRMGFFDDQRSADAMRKKITVLFPNSKVIRVSENERNNYVDTTRVAQQQQKQQQVEDITNRVVIERSRRSEEEPERLSEFDRLMEEARQAMVEKRYATAISIYTGLSDERFKPSNQLAKEYLGVAKERSGQKQQAVAAYERYIKEYPETEGAARMQQRLMAIRSIDNKLISLKQSSRTAGSLEKWSQYGSVLQTYRQATFTNDPGEERDGLSAIDNHLHWLGKYRGEQYHVDARVSAGYFYDLLDEQRFISQESFSRVSAFYLQSKDKKNGHALNLGRQRSDKGGVLGKYDGAELSYVMNSWLSLNAVTGKPVETSKQGLFDNDRTFYGINSDLSLFSDFLINVFFMHQTIAGATDRSAIGGDVRYLGDNIKLYSLLDYDINFASLNAFINNATYITSTGVHYDFSYAYRKSPYLSLRNALLGDPNNVRAELLAALAAGEDELDIALDKTFESNHLYVNASVPIINNYSINAGLSYYSLNNDNGVQSSADINQIEVDETETRLSMQLVGERFIWSGVSFILGYDFSSFDASTMHSFSFDTQFRVGDAILIRPKLRTMSRDFDNDASTSKTSFSPALQLVFRPFNGLEFELEYSNFSFEDTLEDRNEETEVNNLYFGYRFDF